mmetsp:Transcript_61388/g.173134  ORF Transcript_61388/g.173134 Transcript_61388/m.173134 type:complete len:254 (-) Transcript_61388:321-1082(-)
MVVDGMAVSAPLAREKALEMQEALLAEYGKAAFQAKLRFVLQDNCSQEDKKRVDQELRELRECVGARFGFEPSPEGVAQSIELFTPSLRADPVIAQNCHVLNLLLYPQLQDELNAGKKPGKFAAHANRLPTWDNKTLSLKCRAELAAHYEAEKDKRKKAFVETKQGIQEKVGRQWAVIGGNAKGILVRRGEELSSAEFPTRLATNSIVEEMELIADRLHYKKVEGEGPDFGWVSIMVRGATLLKPVGADDGSQ